MPVHVLRQPHFSQLPFPILVGDVRVRDLALQGVRIFPGDSVHVLRPRASKFVYPAQMGPRVGEDGSNYASNISRATGEVLPRPNGSSMRLRSRTVGPTKRRKKPSRKMVGRMVTTGRPDHASACSLSQCWRC